MSEGFEETDPIRGLFSGASFRAVLPYLAIGVLLVVAVTVLGREIEHHVAALEAWIAGLGSWGVLGFVGLFAVLTSLFLPDTVMCILAGALFGLPWGVAAAALGSVLAASLQYASSRRLLRARIQRTLAANPSLAAIQHAVRRDELRLQVLLRLTPLNPATISYLLGAAGVRFAGFLVATLALIPGLVIEVFFGHAGKHVARIAGSDTRALHLHDIALIGGFVLCVGAMALVSRLARKAVAQAVAEVSEV